MNLFDREKQKEQREAHLKILDMESQRPGGPASKKYETDKVKICVFKDDATYRADRDLNLAHLKELMGIFKQIADKKTGCITSKEFTSTFGEAMGGMTEEQLFVLFIQIDIDSDDKIKWDDFSSYLLLRSEGQKLMREPNDGDIVEDEGHVKRPIFTPYREMIIRIQYIKEIKRYMTCCREGTICFWNESFKLQRSFLNAGQLYNEFKKNQIKKTQTTQTAFQGTSYRWILDAIYIQSLHKIALSSDDHQITIYESSTLDRLLCFDLEKINALSLDFFPAKDGFGSLLLYGTDSGHVNVFTLDEHRLLEVTTRQKGAVDTLYLERDPPSYKIKQIGSLWKRKVANDWVVRVRYIPELKLIVSASADEKNALNVAQFGNNHKWNFHVCPIIKGLSCFAYCKFPQTLATGGADRIVRIWNPHRLTVPTSTLIGHGAPIIDITVNKLGAQLISLCSDKHIKIWDIRNQTCLQTMVNSIKQYPEDLLLCVYFNNDEGSCILASSRNIQRYRMRNVIKVKNEATYHQHPIRKILYNSIFKQVISGCDGSVINDVMNGQKVFKFTEAHGSCEITAMSFDMIGRKLITGGRDGTIRVWNHHNGALLQELIQKEKAEVTGIQYVIMRKISYIVVTGWNRKISLFQDTTNNSDSFKLYSKYSWPSSDDDEKFSWHSDDILSMVFIPEAHMVTSSYNGDIVICNLNSGKFTRQFNPHDEADLSFPKERKSIDKLIHLSERHSARAATLLSCGGDGVIRFWHWQTGICFYEKDCGENEALYSMVTNEKNNTLFTADSSGWVFKFDITHAGLRNELEAKVNERLPDRMPLIVRFRAHTDDITDILLADTNIVTCSTDCTIRIFTEEGRFIGIFGHSQLWDLKNLNVSKQVIPDDIIKNQESLINKQETNIAMKKSLVTLNSLFELNSVTHKTGTGDDSMLESWFAKSLYAKNRFIDRTHKTSSKSQLKVYHELTDIPSISFPKL